MANVEIKSAEMLDVDKMSAPLGNSPVSRHYASWIRKAGSFTSGGAGSAGYDLNCGRYLKLALQSEIDKATAQASLERNTTYWDACVELPARIAEKMWVENHIKIDPAKELTLTCGITPAIDTILSVFVDDGDEVVSMDPDFVTSYGQILARNAELVTAPAFHEEKGNLGETRWKFDPNVLEDAITPKAKMILYTNPINPIGYVYTKEDLTAIADIARRHNLIVVENECYERLVHSESFYRTLKFTSLAAVAPDWRDRIITVQGVSKGYHLSGYRIGWVAASSEITSMLKFSQIWSTFSVAPTVTQFGVFAALAMPLRESYVRSALDVYRQNIDITCNTLQNICGIECPRPMAGPFCFMDVTNTGYTDWEFSKLLYERGVNTVAGSPWGKKNGKNHLRLALSNPPAYQQECVKELASAIHDILSH